MYCPKHGTEMMKCLCGDYHCLECKEEEVKKEFSRK